MHLKLMIDVSKSWIKYVFILLLFVFWCADASNSVDNLLIIRSENVEAAMSHSFGGYPSDLESAEGKAQGSSKHTTFVDDVMNEFLSIHPPALDSEGGTLLSTPLVGIYILWLGQLICVQ